MHRITDFALIFFFFLDKLFKGYIKLSLSRSIDTTVTVDIASNL